MIGQNTEAGPFGMLERKGLDLFLDALEEQAERGSYPWHSAKKIPDFLRAYLERGELGVKTGKAFYTYPDPVYQKPEFLMGDLILGT